MPRNMSFAMTTEQVANQTKTVTRRFGWWFLKPGDVVQPVEKAMGLQKGEKIKRIGSAVRIVSVRCEPLNSIDDSDCALEGFPNYTPEEFVHMLCTHYGCSREQTVNRIEFEYF
ncbi:MAG: ASCH domain-containing protein [Candidatus Thiodiazotropha sp. (ex Lucinoma borealis)]|nr:ASCH domain-containing protein [Candidatus Thiodiazotropha sp. (ex Lucinoma borealis)]